MANPRDKEEVVGKIDNGNLKVKGQKPQPKPNTHVKKEQKKIEQSDRPKEANPTSQKGKLQFTTEQLIAAVKAVGHAASSREVSDKLGIKDPDQGRAYVRSRMAALIKDKKIATSKPDSKSRCTFLYSVAQ